MNFLQQGLYSLLTALMWYHALVLVKTISTVNPIPVGDRIEREKKWLIVRVPQTVPSASCAEVSAVKKIDRPFVDY